MGQKVVEALAQGKAVEGERTTLGQRRVNLIWEVTQTVLAVSVVEAALVVAVYNAIGPDVGADVRLTAIVALFGLANLIIGFYFGRTNHQKVGGVESRDAGR